MPGDIDQVGLDNLLENNVDLTAWLTVYPHHGGRAGSRNLKNYAAQFCEAVSPEIVIFSIRDNEKQFPTKEVVETVAKNLDNVQMFSTRSSDVLGRHIEKNANKLHQDGVGHIHLDCKSLKLKFIK